MKYPGIAALGALLLSSGALAAPVTFSGTYSIDSYTSTDWGVGLLTEVQNRTNAGSLDATAAGDQRFSFDLEVGQTKSFDLFDLFTTENSIEIDDYLPRAIEAMFTFENPAPGFEGNTIGGTYAGLGSTGHGSGYLSWVGDNIFTFSFGEFGDGLLSLHLSDAAFNEGTRNICFFRWCAADPQDLNPGAANRASVTASFTLVREATTSVPEPAALGLFGLGLLGTAWSRRRKATA